MYGGYEQFTAAVAHSSLRETHLSVPNLKCWHWQQTRTRPQKPQLKCVKVWELWEGLVNAVSDTEAKPWRFYNCLCLRFLTTDFSCVYSSAHETKGYLIQHVWSGGVNSVCVWWELCVCVCVCYGGLRDWFSHWQILKGATINALMQQAGRNVVRKTLQNNYTGIYKKKDSGFR